MPEEQKLMDLPYTWHKEGLIGYLKDAIKTALPGIRLSFTTELDEGTESFSADYWYRSTGSSPTLISNILYERKGLFGGRKPVLKLEWLGKQIIVYDPSVIHIVRDSLKSCVWHNRLKTEFPLVRVH